LSDPLYVILAVAVVSLLSLIGVFAISLKETTLDRILFVYLNVIGDGVHNLIDGMIIAASFFINITVGLATTVAVIFHELPQEIGDFGVLVYGGFTRYRALFVNFLSALTAVVGVLISNYLSIHIENFVGLLIALAAGGFIYLAASELIPEIQKEENIGKSMIQFVLFVFGIVLIWSLGLLFPA